MAVYEAHYFIKIKVLFSNATVIQNAALYLCQRDHIFANLFIVCPFVRLSLSNKAKGSYNHRMNETDN